VQGDTIDGQDFALLSDEDASEIGAADTPARKARLVCDFLAGMTDGYATRTFRRLFEPGFGSIGDLVG
jgi:dGTPase